MTRPLLILLAPAVLSADQVRLADGGSITGEVTSLESGGEIGLDAEVAAGSLAVRADLVREIRFAEGVRSSGDRDARLTLVNGDSVPCDILAIDEDSLRIETDFAGTFEVARDVVSAAQVGIRPREILYAGPAGESEWPVAEEWIYQEGALVATGRGHAARSFEELPDSFSLAFDLSWTQQPNLRVFVCSDTNQSGGGRHNRYYLQFGSAGFELKRQSDGSTSYHSLGAVNRDPLSFPDSSVRVELRIDRSRQLILLFLDGEPQGRFSDPLEELPTGETVIFENNQNEPDGLRVENIELREWDAMGERHRSEDRGDGDGEALIDHEGQRFSGELAGTAERDGGRVVLFKSPHYPRPLEIPMNRVSTMFFARPGTDPARGTLTLDIADRGTLSVENCRFRGDIASAAHPLLGPLEIERSALRAMVRRQPAPNDEE